MNLRNFAAVFLCLAAAAANAQQAQQRPAQRAVIANDQRLYREARTESKVLGQLSVGEEATIIGREGPLVQVTLAGDRSGWTLANGVVPLDSPYAPGLLFDAAQRLASTEEAPPATLQAAARLYRKAVAAKLDGVYAAEAQWRAAELSYQTTGSAALGELNAVVKLYPKTPQAARAAFAQVRAGLCEFWDGTPGCPAAEINSIAEWLKEYPESDLSAEARYSLAYRHAALVEVYLQPGKPYFSAEQAVAHKQKAREVVAELQRLNAREPDWVARGERLLWCLDNNIGVMSNIETPLRRF